MVFKKLNFYSNTKNTENFKICVSYVLVSNLKRYYLPLAVHSGRVS